MDTKWNEMVWRQFGAAIDMLGNAIEACPASVWADRSQNPQFWYVAYHTLFFLDYYLSDGPTEFAPPAPFTLSELDPSGVMPERVYTKAELEGYLDHGRHKCREVLQAWTAEWGRGPCGFGKLTMTRDELQLRSMRHVQHHTAQLNLILRQRVDDAPRWVSRTESGLEIPEL